jgi:preprotein translocase subunit SecE
MLERQGSINPDGTPVRAPRSAPPAKVAEEKVSPLEYLRQVRGELRKVNWPSRAEVINYTGVVVATLLLMTLITFLFDLAFSKLVLFLFEK